MAAVTYDALLLLSFGGPEGPDDVLPFLRNVTRGRGVPDERLAEVAKHYDHFGGVSPINQQNRALKEAIEADFAAHGIDLPVYWGNRNWAPYAEATVTRMAGDGITNALVFVTSAYGSYSACRQYQDDLLRANAGAGADAPGLAKLRHYFDHPGFIEPQRDEVRAAVAAVAAVPAERHATTRLVFVAHSIPTVMAETAGPDGGLYVAQLRAASRLIAESADGIGWDLAYCSRSGPAQVPWLEPDINDHLRVISEEGVCDVVVVPVGFVSDHIEVRWDLDVEAQQTATELGLGFHRTRPPAGDSRFIAMVRELVEERLDSSAPKRALSDLGPSWDTCPLDCCPRPVRR